MTADGTTECREKNNASVGGSENRLYLTPAQHRRVGRQEKRTEIQCVAVVEIADYVQRKKSLKRERRKKPCRDCDGIVEVGRRSLLRWRRRPDLVPTSPGSCLAIIVRQPVKLPSLGLTAGSGKAGWFRALRL